MARYLITGIAGFIGSTLAHALVNQGHQVCGIDNLSTGRLANIADIASSITFHQADIQDINALHAACIGVDYVLHQAALASVPRSVKDPLASHESNINGTLNVLLAARDAKVKRIVYAASSSAYGDQPVQPKQEEMSPNPLSPYAAQKLAGEYYMQSFCKVYGMEAICLRYFNIYGPRQAADSPYSGVIAQFIYKMMAGDTPMINGDGLTSRDFTFVDNAVRANLLACDAPKQYATGRVFNVGTGCSHTLNDLYCALAELLEFKDNAKYGPARVGDVQHSLANIERGRIELGYRPKTDFRAGLEETVRWYLAESRSAIEHEMTSVETPAFDLGRMNDMKEAQHVMQAYEGVR
ncbi:UDP-glucose 4-epimerase [Granulicella pectinivorans]|uniref:UDP-glucose 4-epimerase n=1 Tax=Granulicella pectinivorans TaxID=474950 RepID=A0A1I6MMB3_9BACT|nr:SDR family oxidoreductase [Granulicella pectinivorans]SFS16819.1 UDP-glucose 4-epimerase [Granulicella pectinivorans]